RHTQGRSAELAALQRICRPPPDTPQSQHRKNAVYSIPPNTATSEKSQLHNTASPPQKKIAINRNKSQKTKAARLKPSSMPQSQ
ncbi:hypothetical protein, partial [Bifidobacterium adolescentis]|uniref:hypothetical protein n=2 Tax=Bifidobacterium adolescentis TaxID=1680 RepID=UPI003219BAA2